MKTVKPISFDIEVINNLNKEENASKIVNDLVKRYYWEKSYERLNDEQLDKLEALHKARAELEKQIKEVENGRIN